MQFHILFRSPRMGGLVVARDAAEQPSQNPIKSIVQLQTIRHAEIANDYFLKSFQSHIISRLSDT